MNQGLRDLNIPTFQASQIQPLIVDNKVLGIKIFSSSTKSWQELKAKEYILATGKYFGGGINLGYRKVRETVFNLPVFQRREEKPIHYRNEISWKDRDFLDSQPWTELGLKVGKDWRVLDESNTPLFENVRACGSVLGGVDFAKARLGLGFMAHTARECANGL